VNLLFSWDLDVCCCIVRVMLACLAFDSVKLFKLVLCSFAFELLYRGQRCKLNT